MSRYDDDYDDSEDERDDDELDDEGGVRRSTSDPYSRPSTVRGAGLPQRPQPTQGSGSGSVPSPIRGGMGSPNSAPPNRSGGSSPSGVQPYQRNPVPPRSPGGSSGGKDNENNDPNDRTAAVNRALGSFGQKLGSDRDRSDERISGRASRFSGAAAMTMTRKISARRG